MSIDISLIPQERIKDLDSTLDNIQNNLSNNIVHKAGNETINGTKTFNEPIIATIKAGYGGFEYASAYSSDTIKYGRLASILINGTYQTNEIQFMVQQTNKLPSLTFGEIKTRVHDTAGTINLNDTDLAYTFMPKEMVNTGILNGLRLYYWNNFDTNQAKVEIWIENPVWTTTTFSIIDTISVNNGRSTAWTFYHNDMYDSFPTDATGYKQARLNVLSLGKPTEDTTSSVQADTVGARNTKLASYALDSSVVHKTGNETITGEKTFTTCIRKTTSTSWENIISMTGNNFPYIAGYSTDNDTALALCTLHNGNWCNIEIHNNGTGGYATIPTPATNDNSKKIATTNWSKIVHPTYPNITTSTRVSVPADTDYSIPYDCWVWWGNTSYVGVRYLYVNGIEFGHSYGNSGHWEEFNTLFFPIKAGNVIRHTGGNSTCFLYQNVY